MKQRLNVEVGHTAVAVTVCLEHIRYWSTLFVEQWVISVPTQHLGVFFILLDIIRNAVCIDLKQGIIDIATLLVHLALGLAFVDEWLNQLLESIGFHGQHLRPCLHVHRLNGLLGVRDHLRTTGDVFVHHFRSGSLFNQQVTIVIHIGVDKATDRTLTGHINRQAELEQSFHHQHIGMLMPGIAFHARRMDYYPIGQLR